MTYSRTGKIRPRSVQYYYLDRGFIDDEGLLLENKLGMSALFTLLLEVIHVVETLQGVLTNCQNICAQKLQGTSSVLKNLIRDCFRNQR